MGTDIVLKPELIITRFCGPKVLDSDETRIWYQLNYFRITKWYDIQVPQKVAVEMALAILTDYVNGD